MSRNGYAPVGHVIMTVPLERELHLKLKVRAAERGKSIKAIVTELIEKEVYRGLY